MQIGEQFLAERSQGVCRVLAGEAALTASEQWPNSDAYAERATGTHDLERRVPLRLHHREQKLNPAIAKEHEHAIFGELTVVE
jgi:hypothetical protein